MKNGLKRFIGRVPDVSAVLSRFPIAVMLMAVFTLGIIFENELSHFDKFRDNVRISILNTMLVILSVCLLLAKMLEHLVIHQNFLNVLRLPIAP